MRKSLIAKLAPRIATAGQNQDGRALGRMPCFQNGTVSKSEIRTSILRLLRSAVLRSTA